MATASDLVTWALRKLAIVPSGGIPSASELSDGVEALNEMLAEWKIDGIDLGLSTLAASSTVSVDDAYIRAIRYNLAEDICEDYGQPVPPNVARRAELGRRILTAAKFTINDVTFDVGLTENWLAWGYRG